MGHTVTAHMMGLQGARHSTLNMLFSCLQVGLPSIMRSAIKSAQKS